LVVIKILTGYQCREQETENNNFLNYQLPIILDLSFVYLVSNKVVLSLTEVFIGKSSTGGRFAGSCSTGGVIIGVPLLG
jgi:hypothetical protein